MLNMRVLIVRVPLSFSKFWGGYTFCTQGTQHPKPNCKTKNNVSSCIHAVLAVHMQPILYYTGAARLVDGPNNYTGRVEVFINGQWGTVCDDGWNTNDAHVICRQLGYLGARRTYCCAQYGQGVGPMLQLSCQGTEESLYDCPQVVSPPGCGHYKDVGVECYTYTSEYVCT